MTEDLDVFLTDFSQAATIVSGGTNRDIQIIFDLEGTFLESVGAEGRSITATAKTSDLNGVRHRDTLITDGKTYQIIGIVPIMDGKFTDLQLKE